MIWAKVVSWPWPCGLEPVMGYYFLLDRAPYGRNEDGEEVFWLRRHDEYARSAP